MKKLCFALLMLVAANTAFAQVKNDVTRSAITFELKNLGIKTGGSISGVQASISFNPAKAGAGTIEATADVNTINTGNDRRDTHLKNEDFFNVSVYPKITMSSVSIKPKGGNSYLGKFNVTIKGKTKLIDVPFTYTTVASTATFKGDFKITRADFGIGGNSLTMSDDVTIFLDVTTAK